MNVLDVSSDLARDDVAYERILHRHTETARDEAIALGAPPQQVAKTIVLTTGAGYVRAVVPASERLDMHKLRELLGSGKETRLATEAELALAYPMFELGAVPPIGGPAGDRIVVDARLAARDTILFEAGSHTTSLRLKAIDLIASTGALVADVCRD